MNVTRETTRQPGQPRSEGDAAILERFDARMRLPIIVSAILPLIVVPESGRWPSVVVGIGSWLVFLVDFVVRTRHLEHYARTGFGRFDLFVVITTAPWFLIPGAQAGGLVVLLRLARLARLVMATRGSRRLFDRLGRVAAVAGGVTVLSSLVAYYAEHPTNPEFATVGDALWWGIVTLTTVGYGDIVPKTPAGRWAAFIIMITGIAVLGLLAGALSSFFRLNEGHADAGSSADPPASTAATAGDTALTALTAEVAALRRQVEALTQRLTGTSPGRASEEPPPGEDAVVTPLPERRRRDRSLGADRQTGTGLRCLSPPLTAGRSHSASRWGQSRRWAASTAAHSCSPAGSRLTITSASSASRHRPEVTSGHVRPTR